MLPFEELFEITDKLNNAGSIGEAQNITRLLESLDEAAKEGRH